jgi:tryptophan-rich sensory protein
MPNFLSDPASLAFLGGIVVTAMLGGWATRIDGWYRALAKPRWQPPDWAFPVVWTIVFACVGIALLRAWPLLEGGWRTALVVAAVANAASNVGWSLAFFRSRRPDVALWVCVPLLVTIVALLAVCWHASPVAGLFVLPYLVWVSIATKLNVTIIALNSMPAGVTRTGEAPVAR